MISLWTLAGFKKSFFSCFFHSKRVCSSLILRSSISMAYITSLCINNTFYQYKSHLGRWPQTVSTQIVLCSRSPLELTLQIDIWRLPLVGQDMLTLLQTPDITSWSSPRGPYIILVYIIFVNAPRLANSCSTLMFVLLCARLCLYVNVFRPM